MGNILRAKVTTKGTRPLIQHHFGPESIPLQKPEKTGVAGNDPDEWKKTCMVTDEGQFYILATYIFGCLRDGAKYTKKGRGSIQAMVAATLQVEEDIILIDRHVPKKNFPTYDRTKPVFIDVCGVVNPSTRARNVRYRLTAGKGWTCSFTLRWDKTIVARDQMRAVLNDASNLVGLADGRSIGNGRFTVTAWEVSESAEEKTAA